MAENDGPIFEVLDIDLVDVTTSPGAVAYVVAMSDPYLQTAAEAALENSEFRPATTEDSEVFVITDDTAKRGAHVVLVVDDTPGSCQVALSALLQREVAGVLSRTELDRLPVGLSAIAGGLCTIPSRVLVASSKLPQLNVRQRQVLELLATGLSNTVIATRLHVSQATVKREVSELLQIFKATNRLELAMRGAEAGLVEPIDF